MQPTLTNCVSVGLLQGTDVVWPVVSWLIVLAQSICAKSSTEAELIAANATAKVTKCLQFILHALGHTQTEHTPIYEDNDSLFRTAVKSPFYCFLYAKLMYCFYTNPAVASP